MSAILPTFLSEIFMYIEKGILQLISHFWHYIKGNNDNYENQIVGPKMPICHKRRGNNYGLWPAADCNVF